MYDLHIICCVNEDVCGPEYCDDADDDLSFASCKYHYSHVNFLVTQKDSQYADRYPILFFAEFDNEEEGAPLLCCRVDEPTSFAGTLFFLHKFSMSVFRHLCSYQNQC